MIAGDIFGERAHITPDKLALVFVPTGERFTYAELDRRAKAGVARALFERKIRIRGDLNSGQNASAASIIKAHTCL